jgi:hypothetical protein
MKKLALVALAAGVVICTGDTASAQGYPGQYGPAPGYGSSPDYAPPYRQRPYYREYDERRYYRYGERYGGRGYYRPGRYRTWNGCQPGWTVQDGLCKPYRGY